ncbi:MAG: pyridine nucleotide-disulfide oxidoreductase/dicluster-binding protein [Oscillospiraceae bacterium]
MELYQLPQMADQCLYGRPPVCTNACPFDVDISAMTKKIADGMTGAAYRAYAKSVVFPGIVCHLCHQPCKNVCLRQEIDAPLALRDLEQYLWRKHGAKPESAFYIPQKNKRVLVIGGNLCGMACASKLAGRGYSVVLTAQGDSLAPEVSALLPADVLAAEIARIKRQKNLEIFMGANGLELDHASFDAVLYTMESPPPTHPGSHIIFADSNAMGLPADAIAHGIAMSYGVESFLKTGTVTFPEKRHHSQYSIPASQTEIRPPVAVPLAGYGEEDAKKEAQRCMQCTCSGCLRVCDMLRHYGVTPPKTLLNVSDTINKTQMTSKTALGQIMGCTQCGLCQPACPEQIDFRQVFIQSRRQMHKAGELPTAHYQYWMDDMHFSNTVAALDFAPVSQPQFLYFPGCQMGASNSDYVFQSYRWLTQHFPEQVGLLLQCCGAPGYWAGDEGLYHSVTHRIREKWEHYGRPVFILACASCRERFRESLPEITTKSLWELLATKIKPRPKQNARVSVFDPCTSKHHPEDQGYIRQLVTAMGYDITELPSSGKNARCCGYGGLAGARHPVVTEEIRRHNVQLGENDYVTYCTNCQDSFGMEGKASHFILELLFPNIKHHQGPPDLGARRCNRIALKAQLQKEYQGIEYQQPKEAYQAIQLVICPDLLDKMNRAFIHSDNVKQVIYYGESSGFKVMDPASGHFICHQKQGNLTFWVEYAPREDQSYDVVNVYSHRMAIEEEGNV